MFIVVSDILYNARENGSIVLSELTESLDQLFEMLYKDAGFLGYATGYSFDEQGGISELKARTDEIAETFVLKVIYTMLFSQKGDFCEGLNG